MPGRRVTIQNISKRFKEKKSHIFFQTLEESEQVPILERLSNVQGPAELLQTNGHEGDTAIVLNKYMTMLYVKLEELNSITTGANSFQRVLLNDLEEGLKNYQFFFRLTQRQQFRIDRLFFSFLFHFIEYNQKHCSANKNRKNSAIND